MADEYHELLERERDELLGPFIVFLQGDDTTEPVYKSHDDLADFALYGRGEWEGTIGTKAYFDEAQSYAAIRSPRKMAIDQLQGIDRSFIVYDFDRAHYYTEEVTHMERWQEKNSIQIAGHLQILEAGTAR